ncbi:MAG: hypothetical protein AAF355_12730 [Myxococcota bacterium]
MNDKLTKRPAPSLTVQAEPGGRIRQTESSMAERSTETVVPATTEEQRYRLRAERAIQEKAKAFEPHALITALRSIGYTDQTVFFLSNPKRNSAGSLFESIEFVSPGRAPFKKTDRFCIVTCNVGLLSTESPLPSYFVYAPDRIEIDEQLFQLLINFFNHCIFRTYFWATLYEEQPRFSTDMLLFMRVSAPCTLHWIFKHTFPELDIVLNTTSVKRTVEVGEMILGQWTLGGTRAFGGNTRLGVQGTSVTLVAEEAWAPSGALWPDEARKRLEQSILPALLREGNHITVHLRIPSESAGFRLGGRVGYASIGPQERSEILLYPLEQDERPD